MFNPNLMMKRRRSDSSWVLFLIGLFSQTHIQVVGSIGISELFIFLVAPFLYVTHYVIFKRENVSKALNLLVLAMIGCVIACWYNGTLLASALRGLASPYGFFAGVVVFYILLRRDPMSFKWYLLGVTISFVICTFYFQQAVEVYKAEGAGAGGELSEKIMEGPIYWIGRLMGFVLWPIQGAYLKCPLAYSVLATCLFGIWSIVSSASGRSAALITLMSSVLILIGGKTRKSMIRVQRSFFMILIGGAILVFAFKSIYTAAAESGTLGEEAQNKLETQARGKKDMLSLLMGGRLPVFIGGYACLQNPIWGYGPWALDQKGITAEFMQKYGNEEDFQQMVAAHIYGQKMGVSRLTLLPAHSAIIGWWLWYGILGLPIWIYAIYLFYDVVRNRLTAVPEFFGFFATMLPAYLWNIFFSPFGGRLGWAFLLTMILLNRMIDERQKRYALVTLH